MTEYQVLKHFASWRDAVRAAGLEPHSTNMPLDPAVLLEDWGDLVRINRRIPTRDQYRRDGTYSPGVFEKRLGPWSEVPKIFRKFAADKPEWNDVLALIPLEYSRPAVVATPSFHANPSTPTTRTKLAARHPKITNSPTYGNPIDFRGLRHEPVNEAGVVFLFGMVARELGYHVEAVQAAYPDCEAKRQIDVSRWQRVRIEFEFESRNFRDHGHPPDGCDVIVCWRHNWPECPEQLEVLELASIIQTLSASEE